MKIFEAVQASARSQCLDQRNCDGSKISTFYQDLFWSWTMPQINQRKQEYYFISFVKTIWSVKIYFSTVNRRLIEIYCRNWDHIKIIDHREMFSMRFSPRSESYFSWWWFLLKTIKSINWFQCKQGRDMGVHVTEEWWHIWSQIFNKTYFLHNWS